MTQHTQSRDALQRVSEETFLGWLQAVQVDEPSVDVLDSILDAHRMYLSHIAELRNVSNVAWEKLALRAEERCMHFHQPLMHRRRAWYTSPPQPLPPIQEQIAGYSILRPLHKGSLGSKTLVALHPDGFLCLLKLYVPNEVGLKPSFMFQHQERMIQRLNESQDPRLEEIIDHFVQSDGTYIQVKPFLECTSLRHWMELHPNREHRIHILREIGKVIQVLHDHQIAHMDLKPEQVLVLKNLETDTFDDPPDFVLIDYDFSMVDGMLTLSVGSAPYYAPEQFEQSAPTGHAAGIRSDTYAFCVFVHRLLSETFPFGDGRTEPTLLDEMKSRQIFTSLSIPYKPLRKILQMGLHPKPKRRPPLASIVQVLGEPELLEQSYLFPTTRTIQKSSIPGMDSVPALFEDLSFPARLWIAGLFVCVLSTAGFVLFEVGLLARIPWIFTTLFLVGCCAFLVLLLGRDV